MGSTPPTRRRLSTVVTIRRAQSERRYLSPWQTTSAAHSRYWQPVMYPPRVLPPSGFSYPVLTNAGVWTRMEKVDHRIEHRQDHRLDHHHHAPRTALIPPVYPRGHHPHMIGQSQMVLNGDLWGTVRHRPRTAPVLPPVQLPPLALGTPMPMMPIPAVLIPQGVNLHDKMAPNRLPSFLSEESTSYRPKSVLSCPESPLYESLVSTFSTMDDELSFPDTDVDHEYQQIPVLDTHPRRPHQGQEATSKDASTNTPPTSSRNEAETIPDSPVEQKTTGVVKISTLDVRPEKTTTINTTSKDKDLEKVVENHVCSCQQQSRSPSSDLGSSVSSPLSKLNNGSSQAISPSSEINKVISHNKNNGRSSSTDESVSSLSSDSDTYQELDRPPTVIHLPSSSRTSVTRANSVYERNNKNTTHISIKHSPSFSSQDKRGISPRNRQNSPSTSCASNLKNNFPVKSPSHNEPTRVKKKSNAKTLETIYLPLTIELPETKVNPRKPDLNHTRNTQNQVPHIITTLDPPIRINNRPDWTLTKDIPPLVVNFGSEDSESDDDGEIVMETDSSLTTIEDDYDDDDTSLYVTGDDVTSIYSSIAELYSVLPGDSDSLVYVYKAVPHHRDVNVQGLHHTNNGYKIPDYVINRSDNCSSCGSDASWNDTVSFVEPTYRPTNLSVGSRGHLKIDYSWSWNCLDDYVRTTSPRGSAGGGSGSGGGGGSGSGGGGGSGSGSPPDRLTTSPPGRSEYSSPQGRSISDERIATRPPYPLPGASANSVSKGGTSLRIREKYSDPVAG